jgi:hypothetical protein
VLPLEQPRIRYRKRIGESIRFKPLSSQHRI